MDDIVVEPGFFLSNLKKPKKKWSVNREGAIEDA
jgi:hypothetical protein